MSRRLPIAPPVHDERNQNETRRSFMSMEQEFRRRLEQLEATLEAES